MQHLWGMEIYIVLKQKRWISSRRPVASRKFQLCHGRSSIGYPKSTHRQNETCAVFKGNTCTDDIEEERKQVSDRPTSILLTPTNLSLGKISEKKEKCDEKDYLPAGTNITCHGIELERPSVRFVNNKSSCSKGKSDVFEDTYVEDGSRQKSHELSSFGVKNFRSTNLLEHHSRFNIPRKLGFDVGNSSSSGETNAAARTRVYHRKTKSTKVKIGILNVTVSLQSKRRYL